MMSVSVLTGNKSFRVFSSYVLSASHNIITSRIASAFTGFVAFIYTAIRHKRLQSMPPKRARGGIGKRKRDTDHVSDVDGSPPHSSRLGSKFQLYG